MFFTPITDTHKVYSPEIKRNNTLKQSLGHVGLSAGKHPPHEDAHLAPRTVPSAHDAEAQTRLAQALLEPGHVPRRVLVRRRRGLDARSRLQGQVVRSVLADLGLDDVAQARVAPRCLEVLGFRGVEVDLRHGLLVGRLQVDFQALARAQEVLDLLEAGERPEVLALDLDDLVAQPQSAVSVFFFTNELVFLCVVSDKVDSIVCLSMYNGTK